MRLPLKYNNAARSLLLAAYVAALGACVGHRAGSGTATSGQVSGAARAEPGVVGPAGQIARQIVRRGHMGVEVEQLRPAQARLERALGPLGGRVAYLEVRETDWAQYTLRVPADRLDALMDSVGALGRVETRTVSAADVTDQVVDTEARIAALRASRDRLRHLLERASTVTDVVTVERELARVQGELESLEGRLNALRGQVALSELSARLERRLILGPLGLLFQGLGTLIQRLFVWR